MAKFGQDDLNEAKRMILTLMTRYLQYAKAKDAGD